MKRIICILLIFYSSITFAEWKLLFTNVNETEWYFDDAKLKKLNNAREVWILTNYKTQEFVDGKEYKSIILKMKFNCSNDDGKVLYSSKRTQFNGYGDILSIDDFTNKPLDFTIPPNSNLDAVRIAVCKK